MLSKIMEQDQEAFEKMCTRWEPDGDHKKMVAACDKIVEGTCIAYARPYARYRIGGCALCSIQDKSLNNSTKKVNALKASKRAARGK